MSNPSWKKDLLRPTQPFFVLRSTSFVQYSCRMRGISHFFTLKKEAGTVIPTVPDACIDFIYSFDEKGQCSACVAGSPLKAVNSLAPEAVSIFGVRFMPGTHPAGLAYSMRDVLATRVPLPDLYENPVLTAPGASFEEKIRSFQDLYAAIPDPAPASKSRQALFVSVRDAIYETDGQIRMEEVAAKTGYSPRYIREIFLEEMGFSPKTFCMILRFQRSLEFLNYGYSEKSADWAVDLGYYDQAQCIRDFNHLLGMTPGKFRRLCEENHYRERALYYRP